MKYTTFSSTQYKCAHALYLHSIIGVARFLQTNKTHVVCPQTTLFVGNLQ